MNMKVVYAIAFTGLAGTARADIKVDLYHFNTATQTGTWNDALAGGFATKSASPINNVTLVSVPVISGIQITALRVYSSSPGTENIGLISINDDTINTVFVTSSNGPINPSVALAKACTDWAGLGGTYSDEKILQASIIGDITGDVAARRIVRLDVDGSIDADISVERNTGGQSIIMIDAGAGISGNITAANDDIGLINVADDSGQTGNLTGDVIATDGTIGSIYVPNGDIGTSGSLVEITAGQVNTSPEVNIGLVGAKRIYADITASISATANGDIRRVVASTKILPDGRVDLSASPVSGDFVGSLIASSGEFRNGSGDAIPCVNTLNCNADITFYYQPETPIVIDTLPSGNTICIGASLTDVTDPGGSDAMIFITGTEELAGQIIINQQDIVSDAWENYGEVGIGITSGDATIQIRPSSSGDYIAPYYDALPSALGGGSIGLAPFNFHKKASVPEHDSSMFLTSMQQSTYTVTIEHYGPVYEGDLETAEPLKVEYCSDVTLPFVDITDEFDFGVPTTESTATRSITITPASGEDWNTGVYRVSPVDLNSAYVAGNPQADYIATSTYSSSGYYVFMINTNEGCSGNADVNDDGNVTPADFSAWVTAFNNNDPECDQNGDSSCTAADFSAWITNFNNGCDGS